MEPSARARPGYSRRAQFGLFAGYVAAVLGIVAALLLVLTARFDPSGHAAVQSAVADLTMPLSSAGRAVVDGGRSAYEGIAAYVDAGNKNRSLEAELRAARAQLIEDRSRREENRRLKRLVRLVEQSSGEVATARLVASTGSSARRYATLAAGRRQGIENGQPVRTSEGLVGRVIAVGANSARILLIVDSGNVVPVKRLSDGLPALSTGRGDGGLDIRALQASGNPFRPGDVLVTSGAGGLYPPNVPVALVKLRTRDSGVARPLADPARLDFALVEHPYLPPAELAPPLEAP